MSLCILTGCRALALMNAEAHVQYPNSDPSNSRPGQLSISRPRYDVGVACACFRFHSSGVKHLGDQACMAEISALSAAFTRRCRARVVFLSKRGETILASND